MQTPVGSDNACIVFSWLQALQCLQQWAVTSDKGFTRRSEAVVVPAAHGSPVTDSQTASDESW